MSEVIFELLDGSTMTVATAHARESVMEIGKRAGVPGILGDCGGHGSCATCHVYIDAAWTDKVGPADELELEMIDLTPEPRPESRLGCQVWVTDALDGLKVKVAEF